jgi:hypothetical protein
MLSRWGKMLMWLGGASLALACSAVAYAQASGVTVTADKTLYVRQTDVAANVTATGLTACAGMEVKLGFFGSAVSDVRSDPLTVTVDQTGAATGAVPLPVNQPGTVHPGVTGACVPAGGFVSSQAVSVQELDAKPSATTATPIVPATGSGSTTTGSGPTAPIAAAGLALLGISVLGAVIATRGRARRSHP